MTQNILFDARNGAFIEPTPWELETKLDQLLLHHPELVSRVLTGGDDYVVTLAGQDFGGPQLLEIDALFLVFDGRVPPRLVVWENKRAGNVHPRLLVGQVLDYASSLASMSAADFRTEIEKRAASAAWKASCEAAFGRRQQPAWDIDVIVERACQAHKAARYSLVVCAESIPDDVVTMARWLTSKMSGADVDMRPIEVGPVGEAGWVRAAAILETIGVNSDEGDLNAKFDSAVNRLMALKSADVTSVKAVRVSPSVAALTASGGARPRKPAGGLGMISLDDWSAGASPAARDLREHLAAALSPSEAEWDVGTSALLLYLKVGDELIEGLRLFGNRVYFVSDKSLFELGADEVARWWRQEVASFPVTDVRAKQPVVAATKLDDLVTNKERLVAFLREVRRRAAAAVSGVTS